MWVGEVLCGRRAPQVVVVVVLQHYSSLLQLTPALSWLAAAAQAAVPVSGSAGLTNTVQSAA